jgi:hypothetical protein
MAKLQQAEQKVAADLQLGQQSNSVQVLKAMTERFAKQVDYSLKHKDMGHKHIKEALETHHKLRKPHGHEQSHH